MGAEKWVKIDYGRTRSKVEGDMVGVAERTDHGVIEFLRPTSSEQNIGGCMVEGETKRRPAQQDHESA